MVSGFNEYFESSYFWIYNRTRMDNFDWSPVIWTLGVFLAIITGLLSWIGFLIKSDRELIINTQGKHETWILEQQKELNELSRTTSISIELIKVAQKQGDERLKVFQESFTNKRKR